MRSLPILNMPWQGTGGFRGWLLWHAWRIAVGASVLLVVFLTKRGTWPRTSGFALCALGTGVLVRGASGMRHKLGWAAVALGLAILAVADRVSGVAAVVLYAAAGLLLVAALVLPETRSRRTRRWS